GQNLVDGIQAQSQGQFADRTCVSKDAAIPRRTAATSSPSPRFCYQRNGTRPKRIPTRHSRCASAEPRPPSRHGATRRPEGNGPDSQQSPGGLSCAFLFFSLFVLSPFRGSPERC